MDITTIYETSGKKLTSCSSYSLGDFKLLLGDDGGHEETWDLLAVLNSLGVRECCGTVEVVHPVCLSLISNGQLLRSNCHNQLSIINI